MEFIKYFAFYFCLLCLITPIVKAQVIGSPRYEMGENKFAFAGFNSILGVLIDNKVEDKAKAVKKELYKSRLSAYINYDAKTLKNQRQFSLKGLSVSFALRYYIDMKRDSFVIQKAYLDTVRKRLLHPDNHSLAAISYKKTFTKILKQNVSPREALHQVLFTSRKFFEAHSSSLLLPDTLPINSNTRNDTTKAPKLNKLYAFTLQAGYQFGWTYTLNASKTTDNAPGANITIRGSFGVSYVYIPLSGLLNHYFNEFKVASDSLNLQDQNFSMNCNLRGYIDKNIVLFGSNRTTILAGAVLDLRLYSPLSSNSSAPITFVPQFNFYPFIQLNQNIGDVRLRNGQINPLEY